MNKAEATYFFNVCESFLADAETNLRLISEWIEDHNESHPHSGLRFLSPREFMQRAECA